MAEVLVQHTTLGGVPTGTNVLACCAVSLVQQALPGHSGRRGEGRALTWSGHSYLDDKAHLELGFINTRPI